MLPPAIVADELGQILDVVQYVVPEGQIDNLAGGVIGSDEKHTFREILIPRAALLIGYDPKGVLIQLGGEYTRKLFTRRERVFGNKIVFEASTWDSASISTKLNLQAMVDRGALTPNEWRATLNLAPVPGGDDPIRRLDTAAVDNSEKSTEGGSTDED